ncbi:hypothetical protein DUI87_24633 [Hirundo rustica rustica]|uniref:Uncharacterized protein n=1 Tax=Hirundo rustica rustica TaxID=333673 RepID=A0A3M0JD56_HIRRU|nr:hypothetical protein DUI87_24633 [Hirundo rustica rustica]
MFHSILGSYFGEKRAAPGAGVVEGHSDDSGAAVSLLEGKAGGAGPVGSVAYRLLPDISRHLWDPNGGLEEESFHATMRHRFPDPLYYYPPQILHIDSVILLLMILIGILQRPLGVC